MVNRQTHLAGTKDEVVATQNEITLGCYRRVQMGMSDRGTRTKEEESG